MSNFIFPKPELPEPVTVADLRDRINLITGYLTAALLVSDLHRTRSSYQQDALAAEALRWTTPYLRVLLVLAERHPDEFGELTAPLRSPA